MFLLVGGANQGLGGLQKFLPIKVNSQSKGQKTGPRGRNQKDSVRNDAAL